MKKLLLLLMILPMIGFSQCEEGDDCENGLGTYNYENGDYYSGIWTDGKRNHYGNYVWSDGKQYRGAWKDHKMNDLGKIFYVNGDYYYGHWMNGVKHGIGLYVTKGGSVSWREYSQGELIDSGSGFSPR